MPAEPDGYDVQLAKVQRPPLRDETLERPRLLEWLRLKVHGRVVLLLADAGYGKTTLLADFSRRTRLRTLWYRLDETDRDWTSFLRHLVAAGQEHDPDFAPATAALLREIGVTGPGREVVLEAFLRELPTIAAEGAVLIFDDFHLVDDAADVRHIARELLTRGPERLTLIFASRRPPAIQLSRLRTAGEVAELDTDALRFDAAETAQLFNQTYGRNLESDVLVDLARRTEGWIASLQLVHAALRDRSPADIRRFVQTLNGADHEMYDYLAEEVVGDLPDELQRFLMDTSILQVVTPRLAEVVSGRDADDVARLTAAAERLTLLSRLSGGPRTHQRYHPLVREFLEARFRSHDGDAAVADLHRRTALAVADSDWRVAAHHYREAGDTPDMLSTISRAIPTIMGNGQYGLAETFIGPVPVDERPPGFELILSRVEMQQGDYDAAIQASQTVLDTATDPVQRDYALLNLATLHLSVGRGDDAVRFARLLQDLTVDSGLRAIAVATQAMVLTADSEPLEATSRTLRRLARSQRNVSVHHFGVTMHNLSVISVHQDKLVEATSQVSEAIDAFEASSAGLELSAARAYRATILLRLGRTEQANLVIAELFDQPHAYVDTDTYFEIASASDAYADGAWTDRVLERVGTGTDLSLMDRRSLALTSARWHARRGNPDAAAKALEGYPVGLGTNPGLVVEYLVTNELVELVAGRSEHPAMAEEAVHHADRQGAIAWRRKASLLASMNDADRLSEAVTSFGRGSPWHLAYFAELLVARLHALTHEARKVIEFAAGEHVSRWRTALRRAVDGGMPLSIDASRLLELVGEREDVPRLRMIARTHKRGSHGTMLGRELARRVAHPVWIEDQGRVSVQVGSRQIPGSAVRRKVLALLCFLISRNFTATKDQVLDALWPDLDPDVALNSLNQTMYFLRRVFEEDYSEDLSPGYVWHDSDVVWLDRELVDSRSARSRTLLRSFSGRPTSEEVDKLVETYSGRFAIDFEYEEWASSYRDPLHAAYLEVVERSVQDDFRSGFHDRGISVARRALEVDPTAEEIEVCLLRLYKATGAHAAAAEQYAHYATHLRDQLGIEPPTLDDL